VHRAKRKTTPKPAKGQPKVTDSQLKTSASRSTSSSATRSCSC
jgi:hypothetical protein